MDRAVERSDESSVKIRSRMRAFFRERRCMRVQGDITRETRSRVKVPRIYRLQLGLYGNLQASANRL